MRAPLSETARQFLTNPANVRAMKEWIDSGTEEAILKDHTTHRQVVVRRVGAPSATHEYLVSSPTNWLLRLIQLVCLTNLLRMKTKKPN